MKVKQTFFNLTILLGLLLSACGQNDTLTNVSSDLTIGKKSQAEAAKKYNSGPLREPGTPILGAEDMPDLQIDPEDIESPATAEQSQNSEEVQLKKQELTTVDKLQGKDLVVGTGAEAQEGSKVTVHYTGTLTNGQKFDSSVDRGEPFSFTVGAGQVIKGWDMGVVGMKVGGKRQLFIPAKLAYGDQGIGSIPPGATLVFEIELLKVE